MKKIKILTIILAIVLISMIGFFGIYTQKQNRMENQIKENSYAMDIQGGRSIVLGVSDDTETIIKDSEGKEVEDADSLTEEEITEKGYVKEEIPVNEEESKTLENYKKTKKIIENRLGLLGVDNYIIRLNEENGEVILETTENEQINDILSVITTKGELKVVDSNTSEVLFQNEDIESATITSDQQEDGTTLYLQLGLNKEGREKLENVKKEEPENEKASSEIENTTEEEEVAEENATEKTGKVLFDGQEVSTVSFSEQTNTKRLRISIGDKTTSTTTLNNNANEASYIAFMINTKKLPLTYELKGNQYILSEITNEQIQIVKLIAMGIIAIGMIFLILKYKVLGLLVAISYIGFVSVFMLTIRYTNVILSLEGILAIAIILIFNYALVMKLLKKSYKIVTYQEFFIKIIPIIILSIVFCFSNWVPISSFAMVTFWGIFLMAVYNIIVTSNLIKIKEGKEK